MQFFETFMQYTPLVKKYTLLAEKATNKRAKGRYIRKAIKYEYIRMQEAKKQLPKWLYNA